MSDACVSTRLVEREAEMERVRWVLKQASAGRDRCSSAFSGAEALTPSERRVARMAVDGLSNREIAQTLFATAKTVENHLGRVYTKLAIGSRTELPEALGLAATSLH